MEMIKRETTIRPEIQALETLFNRLNEQFFRGELESPVITVAPARRVGRSRITLGHCTGWKAWQNDKTIMDYDGADPSELGAYEINISAETLCSPLVEIVDTMAHEMVHLMNVMLGVQDCSRGGTYHNKKFKDSAEAHGLIVEKDGKYGWAHTSPGPALIDFAAAQDDIRLAFHRVTPPQGVAKAGKKPYKYQCAICGAKFQSPKPVHARCMECDEPFVCTYDPVAEVEALAGDGEEEMEG